MASRETANRGPPSKVNTNCDRNYCSLGVSVGESRKSESRHLQERTLIAMAVSAHLRLALKVDELCRCEYGGMQQAEMREGQA